MKSIDSIRDRLASILRETGDNTTGLDCSARRRAVMALLRAAVAEIDNAEWNVREAADYLGVSTAWLATRLTTIRYDAMRGLALTAEVGRERTQEELFRMTQELGDDE